MTNSASEDCVTLCYFITDQLGSVVAMTDSTGTLLSQSRYLPFGQVRTDVGSITQTDIGYTGQRDNSYINLMDYHSRWYDDYIIWLGGTTQFRVLRQSWIGRGRAP